MGGGGLISKLTKNEENEVINPSFKISDIPPYSSSSTFWNIDIYRYVMRTLTAKNLKDKEYMYGK